MGSIGRCTEIGLKHATVGCAHVLAYVAVFPLAPPLCSLGLFVQQWLHIPTCMLWQMATSTIANRKQKSQHVSISTCEQSQHSVMQSASALAKLIKICTACNKMHSCNVCLTASLYVSLSLSVCLFVRAHCAVIVAASSGWMSSGGWQTAIGRQRFLFVCKHIANWPHMPKCHSSCSFSLCLK